MRIKHKLNELGSLGRGKSRHRPRNDPLLYGGEYPFFQTGDVKNAELYLHKYLQTYSDVGLAQSKLWETGTLCITIAANVADTAILGIPGCFPDSIIGFTADPKKADTRFIKYYIDTIKQQLVSASKGTTQDNLSMDKLLMFDFDVPNVDVQRRIANILTAYDDLIENNTRRISILEEMARRIYEEWFVHFRFPGHETVRFVESGLGPVPDGWEIVSLYEIADLTYGNPFKSKQFNTEGLGRPVIRIRDIKNQTINTFTNEDAGQKYLIANGDILIGMDGDFHMGKWSTGAAWLNQRVVRLRPRERVSRYFLFLSSFGPIKHLEKTIVGTTVAHLSAQDLKAMRMVIGPVSVMRDIGKILEPMYDAEINLRKKNNLLRTTRDLLLPRLISGELDVSTLPLPEDTAA